MSIRSLEKNLPLENRIAARSTRLIPLILVMLLAQHAVAIPIFSIDDLEILVQPGLNLRIPVNLVDSPPTAGFNFDVRVPEGFVVDRVLPGELLTDAGGFTLLHNTVSSGNVRVLGYSSSTSVSGSGSIASLYLAATTQFPLGQEFAIAFEPSNPDLLVNSRHALSNLDGSVSLPHSVSNGSLWLYTYSSDADGDALTDFWEIANGLDPRSGDGDNGGMGDADQDGVSNTDEYLTGTDPNDPLDAPEVVDGINYVYFRDHFDNSNHLDRWTEVDSGTDSFALSIEFTNVDPSQTLLLTQIIRPFPAGECSARTYQSIASIDIDDAVLEATFYPGGVPFIIDAGNGTTSFGLSSEDSQGTRVEVQLDVDEAPYLKIRSLEGGVEVVSSGNALMPAERQRVNVRIVKRASNYDVLLNGIYQTSLQNLTLGNSNLRPFVAAEACSGDPGDVLSLFESIEILRDRDADGLADLHEDINLNGLGSDDASDLNNIDTDDDGIEDGFDNCVADSNVTQVDGNLDGFGNQCDADINDDCIANALDLDLFRDVFFNASGIADFNGDGIVNGLDLGILRGQFFQSPGPSGTRLTCDPELANSDVDMDGLPDSADNCLTAPNPDQTDADGDGYGNACDADFNNDCIVNNIDLGIFRGAYFTNNAITDLNGDGFTNVADLAILRRAFLTAPGPSSLTVACNQE